MKPPDIRADTIAVQVLARMALDAARRGHVAPLRRHLREFAARLDDISLRAHAGRVQRKAEGAPTATEIAIAAYHARVAARAAKDPYRRTA